MEWDAPDMTGAMARHRNVVEATEDSYKSTFSTGDQQTMIIAMKRKGTPGKAAR
jgi:hypothetical protein